MLRELLVNNFALIEDAHLEFPPTFSVISGITGAGKTLVVSALDFILGGRAKAEVVRKGAGAARVEAVFEIDDADMIQRIEEILGVEIEDGELILKRSYTSEGRNRIYAGGTVANVGTLREVGSILVDVHSQRENQSLLSRGRQCEALDSFGGLAKKREKFASLLRAWRETASALEERNKSRAGQLREKEFVAFQLGELDALDLAPGEEEELEKELEILDSSEKIGTLAADVFEMLYDGEPSAIELIRKSREKILDLAKFSKELATHADALESASADVEEAARDVRDRVASIDCDPSRREEVEERLGVVERLKRKHGREAEGLVGLRAELKERLAALDNFDSDTEALEKELRGLAGKAAAEGETLQAARKKAAGKLCRAVEKELKALGMENARISVFVEEACDLADATAQGPGRVEFLIRTNVGSDAGPLREIASGGELSRVMLAMKTVLAEHDSTGTLVFDEVDSGVGGRMGDVIGRKLSDLAGKRQVVCITHLPQLAAHAEAHLKVEKTVRGKKTVTSVRRIEGDERIGEIAEMIRGDGGSSTARRQAEEMLGLR